jgi:hypothetical protein
MGRFFHDYELADIPDARLKRQTEKALLFVIEGGDYWIPKSQVYSSDDLRVGYQGTIRVSTWFLRANGLEFLAEPAPPHSGGAVNVLPDAKKIYRNLATKYHPDRSPDTGEMMRDLNELWQAVLSDLRRNAPNAEA